MVVNGALIWQYLYSELNIRNTLALLHVWVLCEEEPADRDSNAALNSSRISPDPSSFVRSFLHSWDAWNCENLFGGKSSWDTNTNNELERLAKKALSVLLRSKEWKTHESEREENGLNRFHLWSLPFSLSLTRVSVDVVNAIRSTHPTCESVKNLWKDEITFARMSRNGRSVIGMFCWNLNCFRMSFTLFLLLALPTTRRAGLELELSANKPNADADDEELCSQIRKNIFCSFSIHYCLSWSGLELTLLLFDVLSSSFFPGKRKLFQLSKRWCSRSLRKGGKKEALGRRFKLKNNSGNDLFSFFLRRLRKMSVFHLLLRTVSSLMKLKDYKSELKAAGNCCNVYLCGWNWKLLWFLNWFTGAYLLMQERKSKQANELCAVWCALKPRSSWFERQTFVLISKSCILERRTAASLRKLKLLVRLKIILVETESRFLWRYSIEKTFCIQCRIH